MKQPIFLKKFLTEEKDLLRFYFDVIVKQTDKVNHREIKSCLFSEYFPEKYPCVISFIWTDVDDWHVQYVYEDDFKKENKL